MFKFFLRSILIGIVAAFIAILTAPSLRTPFVEQIGKNLQTPTSIESIRLSFNDAVRHAAPAVVNIYTRKYSTQDRSKLQTQGLGSGVIVNERGYIITNYHVIAYADQIVVALQDGRIANAQIVGSDQRTDIAILQIDLEQLPVIPLNPNYTPQVGDIVLAIGNPYNLGQTTTFGIISATGRSSISAGGRQSFLQTDAAINEGNSGGALVNTHGELVGINTASFQQATDHETYGISFAIPYTLASKIMDKIIADGRVIRGYVGIDARDINHITSRLLGTDHNGGIIILDIAPNSPAEQAGLQLQDIILSIDNITIHGQESVMELVTDLRPGTEAQFKILRDGQLIYLPVQIGEDKL